MFQDYGKNAGRLAGAALALALLAAFAVAAFALVGARGPAATAAAQDSPVPPLQFRQLPRVLADFQSRDNADGNFRIQRLQRPPNALGDPAPPLVVGIQALPLASPEPGQWLTLGSVGDSFVLDAPIKRVVPADKASQLVKLSTVNRHEVYQARAPGYYRIETTGSDPDRQWYYLFVSPVPSRHVDRSDRDWYLTQFNTETTSNCGPTVAAMSIRWASDASPNVLDIRHYIGWQGTGAVAMADLQEVLEHYKIKTRMLTLEKPSTVFAALDRGHLVAVSYDMAGLQAVDHPDRNLLGQYYNDHGGHYLAIKGYSLDRKWFIVYDPIPSDWAENRLRYPDGVTMIGRNRYYAVDELFAALRTDQGLEIIR